MAAGNSPSALHPRPALTSPEAGLPGLWWPGCQLNRPDSWQLSRTAGARLAFLHVFFSPSSSFPLLLQDWKPDWNLKQDSGIKMYASTKPCSLSFLLRLAAVRFLGSENRTPANCQRRSQRQEGRWVHTWRPEQTFSTGALIVFSFGAKKGQAVLLGSTCYLSPVPKPFPLPKSAMPGGSCACH